MLSTENIYVEYLDWDSKLFNKRICKITNEKLNEVQLKLCLEWAKSNNIDCVYYLIDSFEIKYVNIAERNGFNFVDFRLTLSNQIKDNDLVNSEIIRPNLIREANKVDLLKIKALARLNHTESRFFKDPNFDKSKSEKLFELWIDRNIISESSIILISEIDSEIAGYIAINNEYNIGVIELIGVDPNFRGKGTGVNLILASIEWFKNKNVDTINVVTQGTNIPALRMYFKSGFSPIQTKSWYHLWI